VHPVRRAIVAGCLAVLLGGCVDGNEVALRVGQAPKVTVDLRAIQVRRFESVDHASMLTAATQVMQDLGFAVNESCSEVGVIAASKQRDAEETGQVAGQIALALMFAVLGVQYNPVWDKDQTIELTLVLTPVENASQTDVRASFARHLRNNHGQLWRSEIVLEPELYQEFFQRFAQATFLEGHAL
jgi:hypothetical protein